MSHDSVLRAFRAPIHLQIEYARELNDQQFAAVTAPPGPALVIAGAGSGKTRTLTYRVAYLLEQGVPADRVLLLTFTNKAAREMMRRVTGLLGQELGSLWGGTFHAIGNRMLRAHGNLLGYRRDFSILDREDAEHLIATCVNESGIDARSTHVPKAEVLGDIFSLAVNTRKPMTAVLDERYGYFSSLAPEIGEVHKRYAARKRATNAMDFDDLLALWLELLHQEEEVCEHYQRRFQFLLVDEYQDTNQLQSDLIDLMAARHHNVMVVGDDAQSIYAWRGANYLNILRFPERYPEAKIYKIETNYRSTPDILNLANAVMAGKRNPFSKQLAPAREAGARPVLVVCGDAAEQAGFVARRVLELRDEGANLARVAVLYRSHFHALELQLELTRCNIPFSITSGIRFFEQAHIKDVAAYLKLVSNWRDELSFKRLAQLLPGVGAKGADRLWKCYCAAGTEPPSERGAGQPACGVRLQSCAPSVPRRTAKDWAQFAATISQLEAEEVRSDAAKMIRLVLEAGYEDHLQESYANYRSRLEDLGQLAVFAQQFGAVEDFLTQLALLSNLEAEDDRPTREDDDRLQLSTIHQAKGLEFDVVFVIMLCEGLFPSERSLRTQESEEEERRLMYVAITRARDALYLSYPLLGGGYRGSGDRLQGPSRFLREIPRELIEEWDFLYPAHRTHR
jgi:DNA helicase II / ATP-dependent DNA helicase PcrA